MAVRSNLKAPSLPKLKNLIGEELVQAGLLWQQWWSPIVVFKLWCVQESPEARVRGAGLGIPCGDSDLVGEE